MENKDENKKVVHMNGQTTQETSVDASAVVYKFTPEAYSALEVFLKSRPFKEVYQLHVKFYRHGSVDPFYKAAAIEHLLEYLHSCPMIEVEPIIDMLKNGGLLTFVPQPVQLPEDQSSQQTNQAQPE